MRIGTYQVVMLHNTRERYALRFRDDGTLTGVYGPLSEGEATVSALPTFDYSTERAEQLMTANFLGGAGDSYVPLDHDRGRLGQSGRSESGRGREEGVDRGSQWQRTAPPAGMSFGTGTSSVPSAGRALVAFPPHR